MLRLLTPVVRPRPDLRPLVEALVAFHPDLASFRSNSDLLEAYITTVITSVFCSLHGQRTSLISLNEIKGSNLVDAFDLVASQVSVIPLPSPHQ